MLNLEEEEKGKEHNEVIAEVEGTFVLQLSRCVMVNHGTTS